MNSKSKKSSEKRVEFLREYFPISLNEVWFLSSWNLIIDKVCGNFPSSNSNYKLFLKKIGIKISIT